jgi:sugar phosphate isomerase/epimerase
MARTAINLYSVRELDEPMGDVLDRVADAGYDGVQFSGGLRDATPAAVADRLTERGLDVTPVHVDVDRLETDLTAVLADYRETLGAAGAVVPYLEESAFETREAVDATADRLDRLAARLADHDWPLHYHNHAHEFVDVGGETAFERLARETSDAVRLELDVGWALVGGHDPAALIERLADRIDLVHMKDMDTAEDRGFREIGDGDVDMAACAAAARAAGVDWLIYEHDAPADPAASIETGAAFLNSI